MCGRYVLYGPRSRLIEQFDCGGFDEINPLPRDLTLFNIATTQTAPLIRAGPDGVRALTLARWGRVPSWVKEWGKRSEPINAKVETAGEKPMFRHAFRKSRVLVRQAASPNGNRSQATSRGYKQPFYIHPVGAPLFAFGGLLEHWDGPDGPVLTFAIRTTAANEWMAPLHDRMPVIVLPEDYDAWLDPGVTEPGLVRELAAAYPSERMEAYPVGRAVDKPRAQGPGLIERVVR